jgi:hypothetical protein
MVDALRAVIYGALVFQGAFHASLEWQNRPTGKRINEIFINGRHPSFGIWILIFDILVFLCTW